MPESRQSPSNSLQKQDSWSSSLGRNVTSQCFEDGILEGIFEIIPGSGDRWCVEFGAWDGKYMSNSWRLITEKKWAGVMIEGSPKRYKDLQKTYQDYKKVICVNKLVNFDGEDRLDRILAATPTPQDFDLLSIDIDGNDYHIWDSLKSYNPKVVVIEFNPTIPPEVEFIQPRNLQVNQGCSLLSLYKLGKDKGYELIATTLINAIFVQKKYFPMFHIADNTPAVIHRDRSLQTQIFQLFDGTLVLTGCKKFLWHNLDMAQDKIQLVPRFFRTYPENYSGLQKMVLSVLRIIMKIFRMR